MLLRKCRLLHNINYSLYVCTLRKTIYIGETKTNYSSVSENNIYEISKSHKSRNLLWISLIYIFQK